MVVSLTSLNYFIPLAAFLFVFLVVYALLVKTKLLEGSNQFLVLFLSFLFAIFFVVNASMIDFVKFNTAWFAVFIICLFMIVFLISFTHGKIEILQKAWVGWVLIGLLIAFFVVSAGRIFNFWTVTWSKVVTWATTDWFGMILLVIVAAAVSAVLVKKSK